MIHSFFLSFLKKKTIKQRIKIKIFNYTLQTAGASFSGQKTSVQNVCWAFFFYCASSGTYERRFKLISVWLVFVSLWNIHSVTLSGLTSKQVFKCLIKYKLINIRLSLDFHLDHAAWIKAPPVNLLVKLEMTMKHFKSLLPSTGEIGCYSSRV